MRAPKKLEVVTWGADFPAGCPPTDATNRAEPVFVFVKGQAPRAEDFQSHKARGIWKPTADPFDACKACGLSVSPSLDDAKQLQALLPYLRRRTIASGLPLTGVLRDTPGPIPKLRHMTWWMPEGSDPSGNFQTEAGT